MLPNLFYHPKMSIPLDLLHNTYSKSPAKPGIFVQQLLQICPELANNIQQFSPFNKEQFYQVHAKSWVNEIWAQKGGITWSDIEWSPEWLQSLQWTNSSLYYAIRSSILTGTASIAPVSGMHHASYHKGSGFCTFAGQVLASVKIWQEFEKVGCYLDLDQHFGNSIEDCRPYVDGLNNAIPEWANWNPIGYNKQYVYNLESFLLKLEQKIYNNECHYLVWCHGADSHKSDDLGGRVDTNHWIQCSKIFFEWWSDLKRKIPLTTCLFGGYRKNDYQSVINLHLADHIELLNKTGSNIMYQLLDQCDKIILNIDKN